MLLWIESHGFECLIGAYVFSLMTSVMPPLPMGRGWWSTWLYNILQIFGANAGNVVKHAPGGKQIESLVGTQTTTLADGSTTVTDVAKQSSAIFPKSYT